MVLSTVPKALDFEPSSKLFLGSPFPKKKRFKVNRLFNMSVHMSVSHDTTVFLLSIFALMDFFQAQLTVS